MERLLLVLSLKEHSSFLTNCTKFVVESFASWILLKKPLAVVHVLVITR